jgi:hypothetical protein
LRSLRIALCWPCMKARARRPRRRRRRTRALGREDGPLEVQVSEETRVGGPGILRLDVVNPALVLNVMVVAEQRTPYRLGH